MLLFLIVSLLTEAILNFVFYFFEHGNHSFYFFFFFYLFHLFIFLYILEQEMLFSIFGCVDFEIPVSTEIDAAQ